MEINEQTIIIAVEIEIILVYLLLPNLSKQSKKISVGQGSLVLFYRPTCPACVNFKPIWNDIKTNAGCKTIEFSTDDPDAEKVIKRYNLKVPTIPTIYKTNFDFSEWEKFEGARSYDSIKNWAERS